LTQAEGTLRQRNRTQECAQMRWLRRGDVAVQPRCARSTQTYRDTALGSNVTPVLIVLRALSLPPPAMQ